MDQGKASSTGVTGAVRKAKTRWRTISHAARIGIFVLILLIVLARLAMPYAVQRYVNRTLDRHPEYGGRIGSVRVHLIRGAYSIDHVDIVKKGGKVPVPFVSARTVEFSVEWKALLHGRLVSEIKVDQARLNFVAAPTKDQSQTGIKNGWTQILEDLFPFKINRCVVRESQVWFHDFHRTPQVHVYLTNMLLVATNLSNARDSTNALPAGLQVHGTTIGHGNVDVALRLRPLAAKPTFDLRAAVTNIDITAFNDFLRAYANADVKQGRLDVFAEMAAAEGHFEGYVKPLATDLKVFNIKDKSPIEVVWEAVVAFVAQTFKNHPNDRFGTKVPFAGSFDTPNVDVWETILNVLRNTFVKALPPGLEGSVSPQKVRKDVQQSGRAKPPGNL